MPDDPEIPGLIPINIPAHGCLGKLGAGTTPLLLEATQGVASVSVMCAKAGLCPRCALSLQLMAVFAVYRGVADVSTETVYRAIAMAMHATGLDPDSVDFEAFGSSEGKPH